MVRLKLLQTLLFFLVLIQIMPPICTSSNTHVQCNRTKVLLTRTLKAFWKLIHYMEVNYNYLNLDGLSGIQFCRGTIQHTLKESWATNLHTRQVLWQLSWYLSKISRKSLKVIKKLEPNYFNYFRFVTVNPLDFFNSAIDLRDCNSSLSQQTMNYNEGKGDSCFVELMGSGLKNKTRPCTITRKCWRIMIEGGFKGGYGTTHAMIYLAIIKKLKCPIQEEKNIEEIKKQLICVNRREFEENLKAITLSPQLRDLTLEEADLNYVMGDRKIGLDRLLVRILQMQTPEGCLGFENAMTTRRRLLRSKAMPGGCDAHESGLAAFFFACETRKLMKFLNQNC